MDERRGDRGRETPRHPIGVASERTGLTPDVIRVWERRYGVVEPARDGGGQRLYSDRDVERLRLLRRATEGGRSIGQVVGLEPTALAELVREDEAAREAQREAPPVSTVEELEAKAMALDGAGLESSLRRSLLALGLAGFAEEVASPLLRRLGDGWHAGRVTPAQEHLASVTVRRVLESVRDNRVDGPVVVVGTFTGDRHETGALMAGAAASLAGWRVVYLGPDLPVDDLVDAAEWTSAGAVCASVVYAPKPDEVVSRFRELRSRLPDRVTVYAGGTGAGPLLDRLERLGVRCPADVTGFREALERQAATS